MARFRNISGCVFGKLTVKKRVENTKNGGARWKCLCECGTIKNVRGAHLLSGDTLSCGCLKFDDKTGKSFGKWKVLYLDKEHTRGRGRFWVCECDCGIIKSISSNSLQSSTSLSCGCSQRFKDVKTGFQGIFTNLKNTAKRRKKEFKLDREDVKNLIFENCFYCNKPPSQIWKLRNFTNRCKNNTLKDKNNIEKRILYYNGIDRQENTKGYLKNNCVTCCKECNNGKGTLSLNEWIQHMESVLKNVTR